MHFFSCKQSAIYSSLSNSQYQSLQIIDNNTKNHYATCINNLEKERKLKCSDKISEQVYFKSASNCMKIIFSKHNDLSSILKFPSNIILSKDFKHKLEIEGPVNF